MALVALSAACGDGGDTAEEDASPDSALPPLVTMVDSGITVDPGSVPAGEVDFTVVNDGTKQHQFLLVKTDSADGLPLMDDGSVDEAGTSVIAEVELIATPEPTHAESGRRSRTGSRAEVNADLEPGEYVILCNVVDEGGSHYAQGEHVRFVVE